MSLRRRFMRWVMISVVVCCLGGAIHWAFSDKIPLLVYTLQHAEEAATTALSAPGEERDIIGSPGSPAPLLLRHISALSNAIAEAQARATEECAKGQETTGCKSALDDMIRLQERLTQLFKRRLSEFAGELSCNQE